MTGPLLTLQDVTIGYPGHPVLLNISFTLFPGESAAVLGPNGAGKTAFLKTIAGILSPVSGIVQFHHDLNGWRRIGYVPQRATVSGLLPLTVREVVEMGTYGHLKPWQRVGRKEHHQVNWAIEQVGMKEYARHVYSALSGGQQQRVLIARALAADPAILILDEPLASLDRETVEMIVALLSTLQSETSLSLLWADHFVPDLLKVVQEVVVLGNKKLVRSRVDAIDDPAGRFGLPSKIGEG